MAAEPKAAGRACILQTSVKLSHFDLIHGFRGSRVRWHHPGRGVICDSGYAAASPPRHCPGRIGTDAALWKMIGGIRISSLLTVATATRRRGSMVRRTTGGGGLTRCLAAASAAEEHLLP